MPRIIKLFLILTTFTFILVIGFFFITSYSRESHEAAELAPSTGRFFSFNDDKIFYQELGPTKGKNIFFIHGTGSWSELWKPTMISLAERGYHCIAIDLLPFGLSQGNLSNTTNYNRTIQAQKITALMDYLNLDKLTLVGHSFGGRPTITTALLNPTRIEKLILIDVGLGFSNGKTEDSSFIFSILDFFKKPLIRIATHPIFTKNLVSSFVHDPKTLTDPILEMYQLPMKLKEKSAQYSSWLMPFINDSDVSLSSNSAQYEKFSFPTVIIWGIEDLITPLWQAKKLRDMIPNSTLIELKGIAHIPMIENKEVFFNTLISNL